MFNDKEEKDVKERVEKKNDKRSLKKARHWSDKKRQSLADVVDSAARSDFYWRIVYDVDIPSEIVQKYLLATTDFAKGMQDNINLYVTRDRLTMLALDKS